MLSVKPATQEEAAALFERLGLRFAQDCGALCAWENGAPCGGAAYRLESGAFTLLGLDWGEDMALCDLICRAAFNFALNRGIFTAALGEDLPFAAFVSLGYIENAGERAVDIAHLFTKCKSCGKIS